MNWKTDPQKYGSADKDQCNGRIYRNLPISTPQALKNSLILPILYTLLRHKKDVMLPDPSTRRKWSLA
jgi:hypothetical protein